MDAEGNFKATGREKLDLRRSRSYGNSPCKSLPKRLSKSVFESLSKRLCKILSKNVSPEKHGRKGHKLTIKNPLLSENPKLEAELATRRPMWEEQPESEREAAVAGAWRPAETWRRRRRLEEWNKAKKLRRAEQYSRL